ncbi:hypothetical protein MA16_Dca002233 [Dendrobium catenatum]|uniref:Uncharacterized protein n=1 Tax=Dendrobium catenatum TaxID=906689 RepID=A0A2I0VZX5_9ASPA|nr:hypothetical protein MA16_Dca002233 [Dendrobium catenatum]
MKLNRSSDSSLLLPNPKPPTSFPQQAYLLISRKTSLPDSSCRKQPSSCG